LKLEAVAVASDRDNDFGSIGLPLRPEPWISKPSA
jgi:hypothetical protein